MENNNEEINPNVPTWLKCLTGVWIIIGLVVLAYYWVYKTVSLSDVGGFLAGIFAPVAWLWFVLAFRLQSQQLKIQHKELQLQREEMRNSVEAQQGSEEALKKQSEVLSNQLAITIQQFEYYKNEMEGKKPLFVLMNKPKFNLSLNNVGNREEPKSLSILDSLSAYNSSKELEAKVELYLKNKGGDCRLKGISIKEYPQLSDPDFRIQLSINGRSGMGLLNGTQESDNLIIYLNIYAKDDLKQYEPRKIFDIANEAFKSVILESEVTQPFKKALS